MVSAGARWRRFKWWEQGLAVDQTTGHTLKSRNIKQLRIDLEDCSGASTLAVGPHNQVACFPACSLFSETGCGRQPAMALGVHGL